jgi:hypothetical protein
VSSAFCWGATRIVIFFYALFVCLVVIGCIFLEWSLGNFGIFMHTLLHVSFPGYAIKSSSFQKSHLLHNDEISTVLKVVTLRL